VLIPGLGADAGIYRPQREHFGDRLVVPPWIEPRVDESLATYARRLARTINVPRPFWLGGISFGGMIAGEIAEARPDDVAGIIMIGSCKHRRQVTLLFRIASHIGPLLPSGVVRGTLNRVVPRLFATAEGVGQDQAIVDVLDDVAYRTDISLLKWGAKAIREWEPGAEPRAPVYRAHGDADLVIPPSLDDMRPGTDLLIPGGRHLVHLSHATVVNRWIESKMTGRAVA
jgi:pimeloyl-ACP methyl ester carboxylesterase